MEEPITLLHKAGPFGDETSLYDVRINQQNFTVNNLIDHVLSDEREWGYIDIIDGLHRTGRLEYRYSEIVSDTIPSYMKERRIIKLSAHGGWSRMDYNITELI